jgi:hypothetical protein
MANGTTPSRPTSNRLEAVISRQALSRRLTRKAEIKLGITVSLPPFLKFALDYKADIGEPANNDTPRQPGRTA